MDKILFIGKKTKSVYNTLSGLGYEVRYLELVSSAEDIVKLLWQMQTTHLPLFMTFRNLPFVYLKTILPKSSLP